MVLGHHCICVKTEFTKVLALCLCMRPGAYPRAEPLQGASLEQAPALLVNIRLGWKDLPETNTRAYNKNL